MTRGSSPSKTSDILRSEVETDPAVARLVPSLRSARVETIFSNRFRPSAITFQVERSTVSPHTTYDEVELHLIVCEYDPPAIREQVERFKHRMVREGLREREILILRGEDHFSSVENLFYENSGLTLCFAGLLGTQRE